MHVTIVQQNIDTYHHSNDEKYMKELMDLLLKPKLDMPEPDILMLSEFCYKEQKETIVDRLEKENYNLFYPLGYNIACHRESKICMLAIKGESVSFLQGSREELEENNLRYITGTFEFSEGQKKKEISLFFAHVPQTAISLDDPKREKYSAKDVKEAAGYFSWRMEYKAKMLFAAYCFCIENSNACSFLGGDFNSDIDNDTSLLSIFRKLYAVTKDTDPDKKPTYKNKRFDYALA